LENNLLERVGTDLEVSDDTTLGTHVRKLLDKAITSKAEKNTSGRVTQNCFCLYTNALFQLK
jgi:hypothetical protein